MKDWVGGKSSVFVTNGCSNHSLGEREKNDYYATHPNATIKLLEHESFSNNVWECAVGAGHIAEILKKKYTVKCSDLIDRGYDNTEIIDFLKTDITNNTMDIITNPPYKFAKEFVKKALDISENGVKVAMFLKLTFLESQSRVDLFKEYPPKIVYVSSKRLNCAKNGEFEKYPSSAVAYCWFIWEKGFKENPIIKWL